MYLMQQAMLLLRDTEPGVAKREVKVLDLSYEPEIQAFSYVYRETITYTLREHVFGWRERSARDD